jgi:hypothetical protein
VYGMALIATERKEQDITPLELKLLSIQAGQTASALESAQHGRLILLQDRVSEPLEGPAFPQQELSQEPTRATEPLFNIESVPVPCQETASEKLSANTSSSADTARSSPVTSSFPEQEYADFLSTPETDNSEEFLEGYRPARRWWVSSEVVLVAYLVVALGVLAFLWLGGENQLSQEKPHYAPLLSERAPSSPAETEAPQGSSPAPPAPPAMPAQSSLDTPQPQDLTPPSPGPSVSPERKAVQQTSPSHQLTATAIEKTWLRVIIDDEIQKDLFLNPGQKAEWSAQKGFLLNVGNAGGVRLTLDGTELPQLGASGRVIRNLRLPAPEKSG